MLETQNIFIDTSIFDSANHQYANTAFSRLITLAQEGYVNVHSHDITILEIKKHLSDAGEKVENTIKKFRSEARIFQKSQFSPFKEVFEDFNKETHISQLNRNFEDFLTQTNSNVIATDASKLDTILGLYFTEKAPFGSGKKKCEFPDAFVLLSLENWCDAKTEKMYVLSSDSDIESYCESSEHLIHLRKLSEFLELVTLDEEVLSTHLERLLEDNSQEIEDAIAKEFELLGFWLEDQDGDVNEVKLQSMNINDKQIFLLDTEEASIELDLLIEFVADVTYNDLATASYDSEDKILIPWREISEEVQQETEVTANIELTFDLEDTFEINKVVINTGQSFGIPVSTTSF